MWSLFSKLFNSSSISQNSQKPPIETSRTQEVIKCDEKIKKLWLDEKNNILRHDYCGSSSKHKDTPIIVQCGIDESFKREYCYTSSSSKY